MHRIIIDGNAFYEIDEECVRRKQEKEAEKQRQIEKTEQKKMTQKAMVLTRSESWDDR